MERIWSPWRSQYIASLKEESSSDNCFICEAINSYDDDKEKCIVVRKKECIVLMNKYPYNSGHLLVCPIRHIQNFCQFTETELSEIMKTLQETESIMAEIFNAQGFNIGINIGPSSGAGLPSHLHFHIVPRWNGDFNFMSTIADCKVISESIEQTRLKLIDAFKNKNHI